MRYFSLLLVLLTILACKKEEKKPQTGISKVEIQTILEDSTLSIRALEILDKNSLAFAANKNTYGLYNSEAGEWLISEQAHDSLSLEFRAIANNSEDFFMLSVGNPALLFKTSNTGNMELVYKEEHEKVFYDAMKFWNKREGIAIGDATDNCLSIIITRDGGNNWEKVPCDIKWLPDATNGAAAFAASNTNIVIKGSKTWIATGGIVSTVLYSGDKGKTWEVFKTPIVQGIETTGMYSMDFYDENTGFAIGGDYTKPDDNTANKIRTMDGGKTWEIIGENQEPGYRSCVQYVPNRDGQELVTVGFKGMDYSKDNGATWTHISDEGFYSIRFLNDTIAYASGQGRISKLVFKR
ncbi:WD40/YVTN/BNR-like repeat-containing protein [Bizionia myxarmorum]|uniref:Oxidoreductase n=1 Tax=Bizionia myxarmorum TaxID=291186 RepID=A0A5D0R6A1_9FLAO|nr:oxidoreductase [Bizionia myxarmorum]TYB77170.1 oxidoreductase [Bizionia myxarmorum]